MTDLSTETQTWSDCVEAFVCARTRGYSKIETHKGGFLLYRDDSVLTDGFPLPRAIIKQTARNIWTVDIVQPMRIPIAGDRIVLVDTRNLVSKAGKIASKFSLLRTDEKGKPYRKYAFSLSTDGVDGEDVIGNLYFLDDMRWHDEHKEWHEHGQNLVVLAVDDEQKLGALLDSIEMTVIDVECAPFFEPDFGNALTAFAVSGAASKALSSLPLALRASRAA